MLSGVRRVVGSLIALGSWVSVTLAQSPTSPPELTLQEQYRIQEIVAVFGELSEALRAAEDRTDQQILAARPDRQIVSPHLQPEDLDVLLAEALQSAGVSSSELVDDAAFLRRISLDLTGAPPTANEVEAFVADPDPEKRGKMIDELLARPEFAANWARFWRDVIAYRTNTANPAQFRQDVLEDWLAEQFSANEPWDVIATELITGAGKVSESGPANLYAAQMAEPVEMAGEISRIFLGIQIQCAQCHDHMTDRWTRDQFHEFAAFFSGVRNRPVREGRQIRDFQVAAVGRPTYRMPDLENPERSTVKSPGFFLPASTNDSEDDSTLKFPERLTSNERRQIAASFITGQDNEWFAKAFVNRIWAELMGQGFHDPVDDLGPDRESEFVHGEVLDAIASQWQQGGYDIAWLFRTICKTEAYQRVVAPMSASSIEAPFAAACPTQLRADQIFDSLAQILEIDAQPVNVRRAKFRIEQLRRIEPSKLTDEQKQQIYRLQIFVARSNPRQPFGDLFGVDPSIPSNEVLGTIPQALFLMNEERLEQAIKAGRGTLLGRILTEHNDDSLALDALYLQVLNRSPNPAEAETCLDYITELGSRTEAFEDILWSLINSAEFISRR